MSSYRNPLCVGVLSAALWTAAAHAVEIDTTSNAVFDLYFFGNGEIGQLGENLSGNTYSGTGLDYQQVSGWKDWSTSEEISTKSYWTEEQKQAVVDAVSAWTDLIGNVYDSENRKMRIGFFLDDASRADSQMDKGMTGYASYATTMANPVGLNPTNTYSAVEWLWRDGKSATVTKPDSFAEGVFWNSNLLPTKEGVNCIEVAIVLNPEKTDYSDGTERIFERTAEEIKRITMHELGHAMGMDSKMFLANGTISGNVTTWDALLMLGDGRIVSLGEDGKPVYAYDSFDALCAAGWQAYETWYNEKTGEEELLRVQNEKGDVALVLVSQTNNVPGNALVHLLGELGVENHDDVLGPSGLQGAVFTERDLAAIRALGWQVVPEPSMFGCFAGVIALALAGTRRNRRRRS